MEQDKGASGRLIPVSDALQALAVKADKGAVSTTVAAVAVVGVSAEVLGAAVFIAANKIIPSTCDRGVLP